jgi:hypothetical protein
MGMGLGKARFDYYYFGVGLSHVVVIPTPAWKLCLFSEATSRIVHSRTKVICARTKSNTDHDLHICCCSLAKFTAGPSEMTQYLQRIL